MPCEIENQTIRKEDFSEKDLRSHRFSSVVFEFCNFTKSNWTAARFSECTFVECNLSLVKVDGARFQEIKAQNCKWIGVDFTKSDPLFFSIFFKNCLIEMCNFSDRDLKKMGFNQCLIRESYFTNADLTGVDFGSSDLKGSLFHNTNLSRANFLGSINYSINPSANRLAQAKLSKEEALSLLTAFGIHLE